MHCGFSLVKKTEVQPSQNYAKSYFAELAKAIAVPFSCED
jgi:hypothetical protein